MSAFIVSKTHIDALVHAGIDREMIRPEEADEFGSMLWIENLESLKYRYPDDEDGYRPGPNDFRDDDVNTYTYEPLDGGPGASLKAEGVVHAAAECYDYQSCEHPDYEQSDAYRFVKLLLQVTKGRARWVDVDRRDAFQ